MKPAKNWNKQKPDPLKFLHFGAQNSQSRPITGLGPGLSTLTGSNDTAYKRSQTIYIGGGLI
jgi:hypothetical protein